MATQISTKALELVFALISILFLCQTEAHRLSHHWPSHCPLPPKCPPPPVCPPPPLYPPPPDPRGTCPHNFIQIKQCSDVLRASGNYIDFGSAQPCCSLINDLSDDDATSCLCSLVRPQGPTYSPNIVLLCEACSRNISRGFICP